MTSSPEDPTTPAFSQAWDDYVDQAKAGGQEWPGDDWGDARLWNAWFDRLFRPYGVDSWRRAVEIGQGTGKYTHRVLDAGASEVLACDVSQRFLDLCRQRLAQPVAEGRLHLRQIQEDDPDSLHQAVRDQGWLGTTDALFSIDTLVHLPFTAIANLLLAGTGILREGGRVIFSFAHGGTEPGLRKMIGDIDRVIQGRGQPVTGCFHWVTPDLVGATARFLGYEVELCDADPVHGRDGHCVLRLVDAAQAARARALREPS